MNKNKKSHTIIIVAEDDPDDRLLIQDALREAQIANEVRYIEDGASLMDYLHQQGKYTGKGNEGKPELIILDLNMPQKDGWQVLKEIKQDKALKCIPVVVLTTSSNHDDVQKTYDLGGNGFITKPSTFTRLVDIMKSLDTYWFSTVQLP